LQVDPFGERIDDRFDAFRSGLDEAQYGPKGFLPHELRIDRDKSSVGEFGGEGFKLLSGCDETHERAILTASARGVTH
jgi:hypothetical protein